MFTYLDEELALGVEGRRGLVQQEDAWVHEEGSADGHALLLPARETHATLAHLGLVAVLELDDELVCVGGLGRRLDLGVGDLAVDAVGDVVADAGGKQDGFLICRQFLK